MPAASTAGRAPNWRDGDEPGFAPAVRRAFLRNHLLWPALLFGLAALILAWSRLDFRVADVLYRLEGGRWALHDHYLTRALLHDGAKEMGRVVVTALLLAALVSIWHRACAPGAGRCGTW